MLFLYAKGPEIAACGMVDDDLESDGEVDEDEDDDDIIEVGKVMDML